MKIQLIVLSVLVCISNAIGNSTIIDGFNNDEYTIGTIDGQSGWSVIDNYGMSLDISSSNFYEGGSSLYCTGTGGASVTKKVTTLTDGYQSFFIWPENLDCSATIGMFKNGGEPAFSMTGLSVNISDLNAWIWSWDDALIYSVGGLTEKQWNSVEIEWRAIDEHARFRVNANDWSGWKYFIYPYGTYSYVDSIGISIGNLGENSIYIDALGYSVVPEPSTSALLLVALITMAFWRRR